MSVPYVAPAGLPLARDAGRSSEVSPYRRASAPARRRRRTVLALAGRFLLASALVLVPAALLWWLIRLPRLALAEVDASGLSRVDRAFVDQALGPLTGRNLLFVSLADAQAALSRHPWVGGVEVARELPDRLRVRIIERVPAALLQRGGALLYLDAQGATIAPYQGQRSETNLLVIDDPTGDATSRRAALAIAGELGRADSAWAEGLTQVDVLGDGDFRLATRALPCPLLVRAGSVEPRVRQLRTLLPELTRRYAALASIDLRFPQRIVVRPIDAPPPTEPVEPTATPGAPPAVGQPDAAPSAPAAAPVAVSSHRFPFPQHLTSRRG